MQSSIRILTISWHVNPIPISELDAYKYGSNILSFYLLNSNRNIISVKDKEILISFQYNKVYSYSSSSEKWKSWNINLSNKTLLESSCSVSFTGSSFSLFPECINWSKINTAVINSTHLSSFWVIVPAKNSVSIYEINSIGYPKAAPEYLPSVLESYGVYLTGMLLWLFLFGLIMILLFENWTKHEVITNYEYTT